jgi:hypothetical protein
MKKSSFDYLEVKEKQHGISDDWTFEHEFSL